MVQFDSSKGQYCKLFSKRSAHWFHSVLTMIPGHWRWQRGMSSLSKWPNVGVDDLVTSRNYGYFHVQHIRRRVYSLFDHLRGILPETKAGYETTTWHLIIISMVIDKWLRGITNIACRYSTMSLRAIPVEILRAAEWKRIMWGCGKNKNMCQ